MSVGWGVGECDCGCRESLVWGGGGWVGVTVGAEKACGGGGGGCVYMWVYV